MVDQSSTPGDALLLQLMVESVRDYAIFMLDAEGKVETWNSGAEQIKHYRAAEILGQPYSIFFEKEDVAREKPQVLLKRALLEGRVEDEGWRVRRDGSRFWANAVITAVRDQAGTLIGYAKVTRDLTERRRRDELDEQLRRRLVLADRMASLGTLASGVAHEINNPLAFVTTNLELIGEGLDRLAGAEPSTRLLELRDLVAEAREGCARVRRIVRELKDFSRGDDVRRPVDLAKVAELAIKMTSNEIKHRARLGKDFGVVPVVEGDEARLGQVFVNLLMNAAQAIAEGNVERNEVRVVLRTSSAGQAIIEVRDTGVGIAPESIDRIFDPFYTTKEIGEGTGLGLSISHTIVTDLGGMIAAESEPGRGTLIRVTLPAMRTPSLPPGTPSTPDVVGGSQKRRVLVIDDDAIVARSFARVLREHDVRSVTDVNAALDLLRQGARPDLILCDLMMPNVTGMDFYASVQQTLPELVDRIVFVTGGAFTPMARAFLDAVPNLRIEKPVDNQQLRAIVQRFAVTNPSR